MNELDRQFRCEKFHCMLSVRSCLLRHVKVWPNGGRKGCPAILPCASCSQGAALLAATASFVAPKPTQPPEVLPPKARAAKARWMSGHVFDPAAGELDPLAEVALASPDDRGTEPDL